MLERTFSASPGYGHHVNCEDNHKQTVMIIWAGSTSPLVWSGDPADNLFTIWLPPSPQSTLNLPRYVVLAVWHVSGPQCHSVSWQLQFLFPLNRNQWDTWGSRLNLTWLLAAVPTVSISEDRALWESVMTVYCILYTVYSMAYSIGWAL